MRALLIFLTVSLLGISPDHHYLQTADGKPFFWMGNTAWLMPERLTREDVDFFLDCCSEQGYNVVQVQVVNGVPATNAYGQSSDTEGYWTHMDYIVDRADERGIYVAMVCIWGGLVKSGKMDASGASDYGRFLGGRYADKSNIVWVIGGDIRGDVKPEVWEALATSIKSVDGNHLMTFHPFGRTSSLQWWNNSSWLDFNMFQSGHRRYDQLRGDGDDSRAHLAEDNWRFVKQAWEASPSRPVLDAEPSYEDIPQGLHDPAEPRWQASDCRRYAYWSVFEGACGHTYGHNSIMQFHDSERAGAYDAHKTWRDALQDPGFRQMKHLRALMEVFCDEGRESAADAIIDNGERYERVAATRGRDFLLAYTYTGAAVRVDMSCISGDCKKAWWYDPSDGSLQYIGRFRGDEATFTPPGPVAPGCDKVLILVDRRSANKRKYNF